MNLYFKYLNLKSKIGKINNLQSGGYEIEEHKDKSFLTGWEKLKQYGQQNCGIYISSDKKDRILKCDWCGEKVDEISNINKLIPNIFPKIYFIHKLNRTCYIEMEKFDGDLTDLIYNILAKYCINKIEGINETQKEMMYNMFYALIPKTFNWLPVDELALTLFGNRNKELRENVLSFILDNEPIRDYVTIKSKNGNYIVSPYMTINLFFVKMNTIYPIFNLIQSGVSGIIYEQFLKEFKKQFDIIIPMILKNIKNMKLKLFDINYKYSDNKFDNYAYKTYNSLPEETKREEIDQYIQIGDKFYSLHIIDWDSGLFKDDNKELTKERIDEYEKDYSLFGIFGQMELGTISESIIPKKKIHDEIFLKAVHETLECDDKLFEILCKKITIKTI